MRIAFTQLVLLQWHVRNECIHEQSINCVRDETKNFVSHLGKVNYTDGKRFVCERVVEFVYDTRSYCAGARKKVNI